MHMHKSTSTQAQARTYYILSMHTDLMAVQILEPQQNLFGIHLNDLLGEFSKLLQQRADAAAGHVLEEDVKCVVLDRGAKVLHNI